MSNQTRFTLGDSLVGQGTANCATLVPKPFDDKYLWTDETYIHPRDEEKLDARKKLLRKQGWMVRTHYYPSLGATALKAIKAKTQPADKEEMIDWVKF